MFPTISVADLLSLFKDTGVPITYMSDGSSVTTPRIDLLAALQAESDPPVLTVDEGEVAANTGTDDKGLEGEVTFELVVENLDPTVAIDPAQVTVLDERGTLQITAHFTDPGSDDLFLIWDWDDGTTDLATDVVNPPDPDPFPSPDVNPRDVTDLQSYAWTDACLYELVLTATDDDGGEGADGAVVIIAGASGQARGGGYWLTQYRGNRSDPGDPTLACDLEIVDHLSDVFDEVRDATSSSAAATDVLFVAGAVTGVPRGRHSRTPPLCWGRHPVPTPGVSDHEHQPRHRAIATGSISRLGATSPTRHDFP